MIAQLNKEYISTRPTKLFSRLVSYFFFEGRPLTTKGQWVNPFLFFGYRCISALPQVKKIKSPVFIIGTGRSGSTLLGIILSMHKDAAYLNEPKALWHFAYDKEDLIGSYSNGDARYKLNEADATDKCSSIIKKLYGFYLASVFSNRVVDKYPELIFRIDFVKKIFPDAKFLFLQRNGFDTCASVEKWTADHRVQKNNNTEDWWGLNNRKWNLLVEQVVPFSEKLKTHIDEIKKITNQTEMAAVEWIVTMEEGISHQQKYPQHVLPVRYEDLMENPEAVLENIFSFCDFTSDTKCISYAKQVLIKNPKKNAAPELSSFLTNGINDLMVELGYTSHSEKQKVGSTL